MERLESRCALVTGGGSGIGRASAVRLAAEGAKVFVIDVRGTLAKETAEIIQSAGGKAFWAECDVGSDEQVEDTIHAARQKLGKMDILVMSAGIFTRGCLHELSLHDWEWVIRVNLTGMFLCARAVLPSMIENKRGSIVTIGSVSSVISGIGSSSVAYKVSKAGVLQLARTIAVEYAQDGIRANCVCPAGVETNFELHADDIAGQTTSEIMRRVEPNTSIRNLLGRRAKPEELASVVAFLASDEASFITGSAVMADGGYTAI